LPRTIAVPVMLTLYSATVPGASFLPTQPRRNLAIGPSFDFATAFMSLFHTVAEKLQHVA